MYDDLITVKIWPGYGVGGLVGIGNSGPISFHNMIFGHCFGWRDLKQQSMKYDRIIYFLIGSGFFLSFFSVGGKTVFTLRLFSTRRVKLIGEFFFFNEIVL